VSYSNSPRKGCFMAMTICFQTILGLIRWKTTSIFSKMEDDLTFLKNGKGSQKRKMEDELKNFKNGKRPQFRANGRHLNFFKTEDYQKNSIMEEDLINKNK
jgi:hypothetical protein